jgi:hypothetical protein
MIDSSSSNNESNAESEDVWKISGSTDIGPYNLYMNVKLKRELEHFARKQPIFDMDLGILLSTHSTPM